VTDGDPASNGEVIRVERKGGKGPEIMGDGRRQESGRAEANLGEPRAGNDDAYSKEA
jgi:hypothetical protein